MYLIFDIGGTYTRIALSKNGDSLDYVTRFFTCLSYADELTLIEKTLNDIKGYDLRSIKRVVIGVAGIISEDARSIVRSPNLSQWNGRSLADDISRRLNGASVTLMNDASLGAIGESIFGAGSGYELVAFLSIGTGVGGGLVSNGLPIFTRVEPGHMILDIRGGSTSSCGQTGCLESLVSGRSIRSRFGVEDLSGVIDISIIDQIAMELSIGLVNLTLLWSPDCIILGGGVIHHLPNLYRKTVQFFRKSLLKGYSSPVIRKGILKDNASLYGGLSLFGNFNK